MIHNLERFSYRPQTAAYRPVGLAPPVPVLEEPRGNYTLAEAYRYCERMVQGRDESVPVASRFLPPEERACMLSVYAFARAANDITDEPYYADRRAEALDTWEQELHRAFHGEADHPIFVALRHTIERCDLPVTPFEELLTAYRMDLVVHRYPTFQDLRRYCALSAEPLGRLMLYIFGYRDPALLAYADELCVGLQVANFLQDLGIDLNGHRNRLYLPLEDLHHFGVKEDDLRRGCAEPAYRDLMRFQVARARALLERGRPLIDRVGRELSFELELIWQSGQAVLDKIEAVDYDVFRRRPVLGRADRARLLARALARRWPRFIGRSQA
ncbi:MAG: squalene synthase HpnC [Myxococcales bacterium]|nr:squalene synthase HpnC [Myxococcota bacterium]MDW8282401.1 squalene synthase HpnC [Myxococcales bacterium]